jgi:hypothetical protein
LRYRARLSLLGIGMVLFSIGYTGFATCEVGPAWPDLSGNWAMVQRLLATADLPILGHITIDTRIGSVIHITQSGSRLILQDHYCFTDAIPSSPLFVTNIPDEVMAAIVTPPRVANLAFINCDYRFTQDWCTEVRGAILDDIENDSLPTQPEDPRVIDLEGDGHPGMTIQASILGLFTGEGYAIQRYRYRLDGTVFDANTIVGYVDWTSEQSMLAATNPLFMEAFTSGTDPDPTKHRFVMVRTDEVWSTATLREHLPELLQRLDF